MSDWEKNFPQLRRQDRYTIIRKIGEGGMAVVFQCKDNMLDDTVALKILKPHLLNSDDIIRRFKQEIKIARRITHRNICRIHDFGTFDGLSYIVMEYLEGVSLASIIRVKDAIPDDKKLAIAVKILQGLEAAYEENVIHRDLKPANIMLIKKFEPVIMDFGLARYFDSRIVTPDHKLLGTPAYMAPEQITDKNADFRSDIYSFGIIMYELLTHKYPYDDSNYFTLLYSHVNDPPVPVRKNNPGVTDKIEAIIMKCLEKNPKDRFQKVSEIISDIMNTFTIQHLPTTRQVRPKVLIADDEPLILKMLKVMFQKLGLSTVTCTDGREAVQKALEEMPNLICLDIMMPNMTGLDAAEILLSNPKTRDIPIVILSARDDTEYMIYSRQLGIIDYLVKPIQLNDIMQRLGYWLRIDTG